MTKKLSLRDLERRAGKIEAARTKSVKQQYKQIKRDVMDTCSLDELKGFATMYIPRKNHLFSTSGYEEYLGRFKYEIAKGEEPSMTFEEYLRLQAREQCSYKSVSSFRHTEDCDNFGDAIIMIKSCGYDDGTIAGSPMGKGDLDILEGLLTKGIKVNDRSWFGYNALEFVATHGSNGHRREIDLIVEHGGVAKLDRLAISRKMAVESARYCKESSIASITNIYDEMTGNTPETELTQKETRVKSAEAFESDNPKAVYDSKVKNFITNYEGTLEGLNSLTTYFLNAHPEAIVGE